MFWPFAYSTTLTVAAIFWTNYYRTQAVGVWHQSIGLLDQNHILFDFGWSFPFKYGNTMLEVHIKQNSNRSAILHKLELS